MSHAPSTKRNRPAPLYETDLYAWVAQQAELLRAGKFGEIDAENIAEEMLDVGRNEYDKLESALTVLLAHMLKWDHQPEKRSRSWENSILEQRDRTEQQLRDNPSLKSRQTEAIRDGYRRGRLRASSETDIDLREFPEDCPYDWHAIIEARAQALAHRSSAEGGALRENQPNWREVHGAVGGLTPWTGSTPGRSADTKSFSEWLELADLVRTGLVSGTIVVMVGLLAVPVFYQPGAPEFTDAEPQIANAEPDPLSRIPRPRPDDPIVTGSIRPAAEVDSPPEPSPDPAATAARNRRLDDLQTRAVLIASSWSECDQVESSELFELPEGATDDVMVRIRCGNGTQFVLGESDIAANRIESRTSAAAPSMTPSAPTPTLAELAAGHIPAIGDGAPVSAIPAMTDAEVVRACEEKVAQGLPFPGSLNRALATTGVHRMSGESLVTFDFDALNGFGFPLFFRVQCVFADRQLARLEVSPR